MESGIYVKSIDTSYHEVALVKNFRKVVEKLIFCRFFLRLGIRQSGGMVYTNDSKSFASRHVGSSPTSGTFTEKSLQSEMIEEIFRARGGT